MPATKNYLQILARPWRLVQRGLRAAGRQLGRYWRTGWWQKTVVCAVATGLVVLTGMYSIALWYQHSQKGEPQTLGVTFIADYANYLGVDSHQTYQAILNDLHVKQLRLVSYWNDIEPTAGTYDFSELDYEMNQAAAHGAKVSLAIGLRQPRWPECHAPNWVDTTQPTAQWQPQLEQYISAVVNRYKSDPALQSYQLENEYYLNAFGECHNFDRARLRSELALVHRLDPSRQVIMSRSNNYAGFSLKQPLPDAVGISIYRHVWQPQLHRYITYPFPNWYYAFLAGAEQILAGKPSIVHELQAEPWPSHGGGILQASLSDQNQTFNAQTLKDTVAFGRQTGIRHIDLWGAEYWYYRAQILHDPSVWDAAKSIFTP
jgi:hypothetical protein